MISFAPLRKIIEEREISTYYLRTKCGDYNLDSKTIKSLMTDQSVSTYTLNSLCHILNCTPADLMIFIPDKQNDTSEP